jgi:enolase-phosphatase E1
LLSVIFLSKTLAIRLHTRNKSAFTIDQMSNQQENIAPPTKRQKVDSATTGFNAATDVDNAADLEENTIPLLPRDCKILLLDIEGCTTSISFVHDVLFPFVKSQLDKHLEDSNDDQLKEIEVSLANDLQRLDKDHPSRLELLDKKEDPSIENMVHALMNHDVKATGLKSLQGQIWKAGYKGGTLKGHIYQDFVPMLQWCKLYGIQVNIYSSGSIGAQKLLFGNSLKGDLLSSLHQHFDTTSGNKKQSSSYQTIAEQLNVGRYNSDRYGMSFVSWIPLILCT